MNLKKVEIDKDILYDLYINKNMSTAEIASELNVSKNTINRHLKKNNIPIKDRKEAQKQSTKKRSENLRKQNTLICPECGASFYCNSYRQTHYNNNFCSQSCANKFIGRKRSENLDLIPCDNCGKMHHQNKYKIDNFSNHFCSKECHNEFMTKQITELNPRYKRTEVKCSYCNKSLFITDHDLNNQTYHYCNRDCMTNHYKESEMFAGEKSPSWKGGGDLYYGPHWKDISESVRKRDNYTCQRCGKKQEDITFPVHHIQPLRSFDGDYKTANNLDNLITLCTCCHGTVEQNGMDFVPKNKKMDSPDHNNQIGS